MVGVVLLSGSETERPSANGSAALGTGEQGMELSPVGVILRWRVAPDFKRIRRPMRGRPIVQEAS